MRTLDYGSSPRRAHLLRALLVTNLLLALVPLGMLSQTGLDLGLMREASRRLVTSDWPLLLAIGLLDAVGALVLTRAERRER
jgi:hypothetical protein